MPKRLPRARTLKGDPKLAYYDSAGGVAGEPVILLLHQSLARSEDWENIFPRLATRYRTIAYDARGHGKSGRASEYTLRAFADDALRVLREIAKAPALPLATLPISSAPSFSRTRRSRIRKRGTRRGTGSCVKRSARAMSRHSPRPWRSSHFPRPGHGASGPTASSAASTRRSVS